MKSRIFTLSTFIILFLLPEKSSAQFFRASIVKDNNDIVFYAQPNPGGGNITTSWIDIEFFLRLPQAEASGFNFGTITVNATDFPGVSIPYNGADVQGTENGYENYWFGTSFSSTPMITYTEGQEYEIFRVTLDIDPASKNFELVHNATTFITYVTMTNSSGIDLMPSSGVKFYGTNPMICTTCPVGATNHVVELGLIVLPAELIVFEAQLLNEDITKLNWTTASEINSSHFEIEKSKDGIFWDKIGIVQSANRSNEVKKYIYQDNLSNKTLNPKEHIYYRLKMVDLDDSYEYSQTRVVQRTISNVSGAAWNLYPNPVRSGQTVQLRWQGKTANVDHQLRVYSLQGQLIWERDYSKINEDEHIEIPAIASSGMYLVEWQTGDGNTWTERLVVQ